MRLTKRGRVWFCYVYVNGKRVQRSTRCHDRRAAEAVARRLEADAADPTSARAATATLSDALTLLLDQVDAEVKAGKGSAATRDMYRQKAKQLVRVFETRNGDGVEYAPRLLTSLDAAAVDDYIARRRTEEAMPAKAAVEAKGRRKARPARPARYVSEHTIHKELTTLRVALKLAARRGLWRGVVAAVMPVGFSPQYKPRKRWLTPAELKQLFPVFEPDRAARIAFLAVTSARWSESDGARRGDVAADYSFVHLRGTKTEGSNRIVPVVTAEARSLLKYAVEHAQGRDGMLFTRWTNRGRDIKAACRRAGVEPCTPNDLRRSFAQWLRRAGAPAELVAPAMGHASPQMVRKVYGELDATALGDALAAALGLAPLPALAGAGGCITDCISGASQSVPPMASTAPVAQGNEQNSPAIAAEAVGPVGVEPTTNGLKVPAPPTRARPDLQSARVLPLWPLPKAPRAASKVHHATRRPRKAASAGPAPLPSARAPKRGGR